MKRFAVIFPILSGTFWGSCGIFVRSLSGAELNNITILFLRAFVSTIFLLFLILLKDRSLLKINLRDLPLFLSFAINGITIMNFFYNLAMNTVSLSLAAVLLSTCPVFVMIIAAVLFGEKITPLKVSCMLATIAGCFMLSGVLDGKEMIVSGIGILFGIGAAVFNAIYITTVKALTNRNYNNLTILFYGFMFASVVLLFFCDFRAVGSFVKAEPLYGITLIISQSAVSTLLPNLLFTKGMQYMESGKVTVFSSGAEPVSAMLFGLFIYKEVPTVFGILGLITVITALTVLTLKGEKTE
ncbi:MAG: DMT family transporter [Clostridia bacterium]|nr:DMT family transporter [Clostridia bacterium]